MRLPSESKCEGYIVRYHLEEQVMGMMVALQIGKRMVNRNLKLSYTLFSHLQLCSVMTCEGPSGPQGVLKCMIAPPKPIEDHASPSMTNLSCCAQQVEVNIEGDGMVEDVGSFAHRPLLNSERPWSNESIA